MKKQLKHRGGFLYGATKRLSTLRKTKQMTKSSKTTKTTTSSKRTSPPSTEKFIRNKKYCEKKKNFDDFSNRLSTTNRW